MSWWRHLIPPPRRGFRWTSVWPLLAFLVVFGAVVGVLEWRRLVTFSRPWAFGWLAVLPWMWWLHVSGFTGLGQGRALAALWTRLLVAGLLVLALTEPRAVRRHDVLSVVYALDVSDSMGEKVSDQSLAYVLGTASAKPEKDEAGLVVFGKEAAVELPPRVSFPFEVINSRVSRDGTDLAKALSLAAALIPEQNQGRLVLLSDGTATEGTLANTLEDLKRRQIAVDVLPVQYDFPNEVWLERLELPKQVKLGETYEATVLLSALQPGQGKLVLRENDKVIAEQTVKYNAGKNRFALPLYLRQAGYYEYVATIEPAAGADGWRENNVTINSLHIRGEGKVLVVTDPQGDPRDWQTLVKAISAAERAVEVRSAYEFPRDPLSLLPYDCILFVNAPADSFDAVQQEALRSAVYHQGTGFLMVGGANSFGPGGFHRTPIEEALPVTMDIAQKKVLPKGALVIVLHTCEFPEGNVWAKRIAKEAIRVLGTRDEAGILVYHNTDQWVFPLTPAGQYERLVPLINQCDPWDMPNFASIMQMGFNALKASDAAAKHMLIISDGDPSPPPPELVQQFVAHKISVSPVIINPHGGQDISMMRALASTTGGRYYLPQDPAQLPSIFIKEAKTLKRSMIQNKTFVPRIEFSSPILKGCESLPALRGYVLTSPKPRATTILRGPETEDVDPVLASWRFGLGTTAAFTADLSPNWGADWVGWDRYQAFVKQLLIDISRAQTKQQLQMTTHTAGNEGLVVIEDNAKEDSLLEIEVQAIGPGQRTESLRLQQTGPRRYQGRFPLWGKGNYQVVAAAAGAGRNEQAVGGFVVAYSPEYLRFRSDPITLQNIARTTGGRLLTGREVSQELFGVARQPREFSRPVLDWVLLALAILVPIDVGVRRIQLDWAVIRGWLGFGGKKESTATLGALLRKKQEVTRVLPTSPIQPVSAPTILPGQPPAPRPAAKPVPAAPATPPSPAGPVTTTSQLLARKRQRQSQEQGDSHE